MLTQACENVYTTAGINNYFLPFCHMQFYFIISFLGMTIWTIKIRFTLSVLGVTQGVTLTIKYCIKVMDGAMVLI